MFARKFKILFRIFKKPENVGQVNKCLSMPPQVAVNKYGINLKSQIYARLKCRVYVSRFESGFNYLLAKTKSSTMSTKVPTSTPSLRTILDVAINSAKRN